MSNSPWYFSWRIDEDGPKSVEWLRHFYQKIHRGSWRVPKNPERSLQSLQSQWVKSWLKNWSKFHPNDSKKYRNILNENHQKNHQNLTRNLAKFSSKTSKILRQKCTKKWWKIVSQNRQKSLKKSSKNHQNLTKIWTKSAEIGRQIENRCKLPKTY